MAKNLPHKMIKKVFFLHEDGILFASMQQRSSLSLVVIGHVDHGKSTLMGRLLHDTGSLPADKVEAVKKLSAAQGRSFEYAFLLDAFWEEQAQNITIDTMQLQLQSPRRSFTLIDVPGHREFLKNMMTGAAQAQAALLLVDVERGIEGQTKEHLALLPLLGMKEVVVLINKMDRIDNTLKKDAEAGITASEVAYQKRSEEVLSLTEQFGLQVKAFLPVVATQGWNITPLASGERREQLDWYEGPSLLELLEEWEPPLQQEEDLKRPLRMIVQDIYQDACQDAAKKPLQQLEEAPESPMLAASGDRRLIVGKVLSGSVAVEEEVVFWPAGKKGVIAAFEEWGKEEPLLRLYAGAVFAMRLQEPLFVERGEMISHSKIPPHIGKKLQLRLFWFGKRPLEEGNLLKLQLGTAQHTVKLVKIVCGDQEKQIQQKSFLEEYDWGEVAVRMHQSIAYDYYEDFPQTGRVSLVQDGYLAGAGMILPAEEIKTSVDSKKRAVLSAPEAFILLTGLSGAGKSTLGGGLVNELQQRGQQAFLLDGDQLRRGLSADLGFSAEDRCENIRRVGEVGILLAQAGVVAVAALIAPLADEREKVRARCTASGVPFIEVFVDASLQCCEARDPKGLYRRARAGEISQFTGIDSPYEPPANPEIVISTEQLRLEEALEKLLRKIEDFLLF